jgi:hypothetical protein
VSSHDRPGFGSVRDEEAKDAKRWDDCVEIAARKPSQVVMFLCESYVLDGKDHDGDLSCDLERVLGDADDPLAVVRIEELWCFGECFCKVYVCFC